MKYFALLALISVAAAKPEATDPYNAWDSIKDGAEDGKYERVVTSHFSSDSDDIFMRSMIKKYAVEERTDHETLDDGQKVGGEPTGLFWMTRPPPPTPPRRFSTPIRVSLVRCSTPTWIPTSTRPGLTSMSTSPVKLRSSRCHNS